MPEPSEAIHSSLLTTNLYGGVSRQAAAVRHANQVENADNVLFSVRAGASKRPGSVYVNTIGPVPLGYRPRLHAIDRDAEEEYLILYDRKTLRAFEAFGVEAKVDFDLDAWRYFAALGDGGVSAWADDLRMTSIADYTMIVNTTLAVGNQRSAFYEVTETHKDFDVLSSWTPATGTYHRARDGTAAVPSGYWQYDPGEGATFAYCDWPARTALRSAPAYYQTNIRNPGGMTVDFRRLILTVNAGTWDNSEMTFAQVGKFADYEWYPGDQIHITNVGAGAHMTIGWYNIDYKIDDDSIVLSENPSDGNDDNTITATSVGMQVEFHSLNMQTAAITDMDDVALAFQDAFRDAGAYDTCVAWIWDTGDQGHFQLTAPYRGADAAVLTIAAPALPFDWEADSGGGANAAWDEGTKNAVAGTGTPDSHTLDVLDRWERMAPPNQAEAVLDPATMPIRMVRTALGPAEPATYAASVFLDDFFSHFGLDEAAGANAVSTANADGDSWTGVFQGVEGVNYWRNQVGPITCEVGNVAARFDGAAGWLKIAVGGAPDFGDLGYAMRHGFAIEAWIKPTSTPGCIAGVEVNPNPVEGFFFGIAAGGELLLWIGRVGDYTEAVADADCNLNDGDWHHVAARWLPYRGQDWTTEWDVIETIKLYVDGKEIASTMDRAHVGPHWDDELRCWTYYDYGTWTDDVGIGAYNRGVGGPEQFFEGTIDEVVFYGHPAGPGEFNYHRRRATDEDADTPATFEVSPADWSFRKTGNKDSNPLLSLWEYGLSVSDISFHRNRLLLTGDENVLLSQSGDFFNFFIEDAENLGDADPIDLALSADRVTLVDYVIPFRKGLVIFTKSGQQFELNAPETLTPQTAAITPTTAYRSEAGVRPVRIGNQVYFAAPMGNTSQVYEYYYSDLDATSSAKDVSGHIQGYLPEGLRTLTAGANEKVVFGLTGEDAHLYAYRFFWSANTKVQSAWGRYNLAPHPLWQRSAIECDGTAGGSIARVETPFDAFGGHDMAVMRMWVYPDTTPGGGEYRMLYVDRFDDDTERIMVTQRTNQGITLWLRADAGDAQQSYASPNDILITGQWNSLLVVIDTTPTPAEASIWVNGELEVNAAAIGNVTNGFTATTPNYQGFGARRNGTNAFDGRLAALALIGVDALPTLAEAVNLHVSPYKFNELAYDGTWPADDKDGVRCLDTSGGFHHLTLAGPSFAAAAPPDLFTLRDAAVIKTLCFLLLEDADDNYLLTGLGIEPDETNAGMPTDSPSYWGYLDRTHYITGGFAAGVTTWVLPVPDGGIDTVILGPDFEAGGTVLETTRPTTATIQAAGDYSAHACIVGQAVPMVTELSRPYARDDKGNARFDLSVQLDRLIALHKESGGYELDIRQPDRGHQVAEFTPEDRVDSEGRHEIIVSGDSENTKLYIVSRNALPVNLAAVEYVVTVTPRSE